MPALTIRVIICASTMDRWDGIRDGVVAFVEQSLPPAALFLLGDNNSALTERAGVDLVPVLQLVASFSEPEVMMVGGQVIPNCPGGAAPAWFPPEFLWVVGSSYVGLPPITAEVQDPQTRLGRGWHRRG